MEGDCVLASDSGWSLVLWVLSGGILQADVDLQFREELGTQTISWGPRACGWKLRLRGK